ncbi:MAG: hypothetical protein KJO07_17060, partial [Deltaproteobacteria bacterium]|nr:hypothetical protein [Deltaproteobacteria bacterium]
KLHLGQLDDSGLTAHDLRRISDSLFETIKHAHHTRIEYPWQKKERAEAEANASAATGKRPKTEEKHITSQFAREPRLDSLDVPRPMNRRAKSVSASPLETAPTQKLDSGEVDRPESPRKQRALTIEEGPHEVDTGNMERVVSDAIDQALDEAGDADGHNGRGGEISLLGDQAESGPVVQGRAGSESEELQAGMVVVGPPPATRRSSNDDD